MRAAGGGGVYWLDSPAKINLSLCILGERADGYHELDTWMQQVSLYDRIWIRPGGKVLRVSTDRSDVPDGRANLAYRAAAALRRAAAPLPAAAGAAPLGADIFIEKHIPAGAGLGGGSGDAAAVLWALNRLWGLSLPKSRLAQIAAGLGSDVPFFLGGVSARCRGRGERVRSCLPLKKGWILVVKPAFSLSAAEVYDWYRAAQKAGAGAPPASGEALENDLESIVFRKRPRLRRLREALRAQGAERVQMSGSGPALFAIFSRQKDALAAAREFSGRRGWLAEVVRPLQRSALRGGGLKKAEDGECPVDRFL